MKLFNEIREEARRRSVSATTLSGFGGKNSAYYDPELIARITSEFGISLTHPQTFESLLKRKMAEPSGNVQCERERREQLQKQHRKLTELAAEQRQILDQATPFTPLEVVTSASQSLASCRFLLGKINPEDLKETDHLDLESGLESGETYRLLMQEKLEALLSRLNEEMADLENKINSSEQPISFDARHQFIQSIMALDEATSCARSCLSIAKNYALRRQYYGSSKPPQKGPSWQNEQPAQS